MSPFEWLRRVFGKPEVEETRDGAIPDLDADSSYLWSQHMRIVLAIVVVFISAGIMWWILA